MIPGGRGIRRAVVSERIADWIVAHADQTRRIAAIGDGIYGLAPTGLLDGREVTTHWRYATDVTRRFPKLRVAPRRPLVKDGAFYTSSGPGAAVDLSLALIEEDYGPHVALAVAQEFVTSSVNGNGQGKLPKLFVFDSQPADRFAELVPGSCEICMKTCRLMLWRGESACVPATLIAPSRVYSATRQLSLWKGCASMRQSDAFLFRSELSIPLLPPLASQMHKRFGAHSNGDLVQNRAATSRPSL